MFQGGKEKPAQQLQGGHFLLIKERIRVALKPLSAEVGLGGRAGRGGGQRECGGGVGVRQGVGGLLGGSHLLPLQDWDLLIAVRKGG